MLLTRTCSDSIFDLAACGSASTVETVCNIKRHRFQNATREHRGGNRHKASGSAGEPAEDATNVTAFTLHVVPTSIPAGLSTGGLFLRRRFGESSAGSHT